MLAPGREGVLLSQGEAAAGDQVWVGQSKAERSSGCLLHKAALTGSHSGYHLVVVLKLWQVVQLLSNEFELAKRFKRERERENRVQKQNIE